MTLFRETIEFFRWLLQVILAFIRVRPLTTVAIIVMSASSHILHVLVFLMPLKVLMLAASPGVPGKLSFFIQPEHKELWVYVLAGASIASYFLMLVFDSLSDRLSFAGSQHLLSETEAIPLFENQKTLAQFYYSSFSQLGADIIFVGTAFLAGFFIYFQFFAFLICATFFLFLVSCALIRASEKSLPGTISYYIQQNYSSYLSILSSLFFLSAFVFLLIPFLFYDSTNFLLAIVSFIILRRTLSTIISSIKNAIKLSSQKHRINALIFPNVQLQEKQKPEELAFLEFFNKQERTRHAAQALEQVLPIETDLDVIWEDPIVPGVNTFAIAARNIATFNTRCFRLNVFPPKQTFKIENEEFLFRHISRHQLKAPEMISLYFAGQFQCQILEYGLGKKPESKQWQSMEHSLLEHVWCSVPPQDLVRTCQASAPMLYDRLLSEFVSQLELGADDEQERQTLKSLLDMLPGIRSRLKELPLHIYNPDLKKNNVSLGKDQEPFIMFWGRWSLEPIGVALPERLKGTGVSRLVERVREQRKDLPTDYSEKDIFLAADCWDLEQHIKKKRYKSALQATARIIESYPQGLQKGISRQNQGIAAVL